MLGNLVDFFAPFVTRDATVVTIFIGGNDVEVVMSALGGGAGASNQTAPIVAINLPNFAGIPMHSSDPLLDRQDRNARRSA